MKFCDSCSCIAFAEPRQIDSEQDLAVSNNGNSESDSTAQLVTVVAAVQLLVIGIVSVSDYGCRGGTQLAIQSVLLSGRARLVGPRSLARDATKNIFARALSRCRVPVRLLRLKREANVAVRP